MAGIYLHIPFCKTRCIYCDFYSTTRSELKTHYVHTLCRELEMRKEYLKGEPVETIYFGGGTPSQLEEADFKHIFETIRENYGMEHCRRSLWKPIRTICPGISEDVILAPFQPYQHGDTDF